MSVLWYGPEQQRTAKERAAQRWTGARKFSPDPRITYTPFPQDPAAPHAARQKTAQEWLIEAQQHLAECRRNLAASNAMLEMHKQQFAAYQVRVRRTHRRAWTAVLVLALLWFVMHLV